MTEAKSTEELNNDLDDSLWEHFSESSVENCLARMKQNVANVPVSTLMCGRGAARIWPVLEDFLKRNLCLKDFMTLSCVLPFREIATLISDLPEFPLSDNSIIEKIKAGETGGGLRFLPTQQLQAIICSLTDAISLSAIEDVSAVENMLWGHYIISDNRISDAALAWCLARASDRRIIPLLARDACAQRFNTSGFQSQVSTLQA